MTRARTRDMFFTMAVFCIPLVLITWMFQRAGQQEPQVPEVDWQAVVVQADGARQFDVLRPTALPAGWRATKARWLEPGQADGNGNASAGYTLELGFISEDDQYFALNQTTAPSAPFVKRVSRDGREQGQVDVEGRQWTHYQSADGRTHALVLVEGKVSRIVASDAGVERLRQFASLLTGP